MITGTRWAVALAMLCAFSPPAAALPIGPGESESAPQPPVAPGSPAAARFELGTQALARGELDAAERAFREVLRMDPGSAQPLLGLAEVALRRSRPDEAWAWLEKARSLAPKSAEVHHAIARYHIIARKYDKAEAALKKTLALDARNLRAQLDLGDLYVNVLNSPIQAIPAYRAAIAIDPKHAGAHHGLGMALMGTGKAALAEEEFRKAAGLAPKNPLPHQALARLYVRQGQPDKALAAYADALKVQPGFMPAALGRGDVFLDRGDPASAAAEYRRAAQAAPNSDVPRVKLGMALQAAGKPGEAQQAYEEAIRLNPAAALAYNNLAWLAVERRGDLDQALRRARKAVELKPVAASFQDTLGWVYRARGELSEAEDTLRKAAKIKPESAEVFHHLGMVYLDRDKRAEAERAFRDALLIRKDYAPAREALSRMGRQR